MNKKAITLMALCVNTFVCAMLDEDRNNLFTQYVEGAVITRNLSMLLELEEKRNRHEDITPLLQEFEEKRKMLEIVFSAKL